MRDYSEFEPNPAAVQQLAAAVDEVFAGRSGAGLFGEEIAREAVAESLYQPDAGVISADELADSERAALEAMYNSPSAIVDERCLSEVDHLNNYRQKDGTHGSWVFGEVLKNLVPAVKEAAMPYAVSTTFQEFVPSGEHDAAGRQLGVYKWLGRTALEVAESGKRFHKHVAALARVDVEIAEARSIEQTLEPGMLQVFISPKMSAADASHEVAESEHLADDDALRVTWIETDDDGAVQGKYLQSLLVRDVPLAAWVAMLHDPENIFGKSVGVRDESSALAVMETYDELRVPAEVLPEGVVSLVEAVLPYIADGVLREKVSSKLPLFRTGQEDMHQKAERVAERWLQFEVALSDSLHAGWATSEILNFIAQFPEELPEDVRLLLADNTLQAGQVAMSRELAAKLETARQNTLWTAAAVVTQNEQVLEQLSPEVAKQIYANEMVIQQMQANNASYQAVLQAESAGNRLIAQQNIAVGAGCPGSNQAFKQPSEDGSGSENGATAALGKDEEKSGKKGMKCPFCNAKVFDDPCARVLLCGDCGAMAVNGRIVYKGDGGSKKRETDKRDRESVLTEHAVQTMMHAETVFDVPDAEVSLAKELASAKEPAAPQQQPVHTAIVPADHVQNQMALAA